MPIRKKFAKRNPHAVKPVTRVPVTPRDKSSDQSWYSNPSGWDARKYDTLGALLNSADDAPLLDNEEIIIDFKYPDSKTEKTLRFESRCFEHCCGIHEIGSLSIAVMSNKDMDELFKCLFEEIRGNSVQITTIPSQKEWERYLSESTLFQAVKTWKNGGKGNLITLWVSTN